MCVYVDIVLIPHPFPSQDVVVGSMLGHGTFGDIYMGSLKKPPSQMKGEWDKEEFPRKAFIKSLRSE